MAEHSEEEFARGEVDIRFFDDVDSSIRHQVEEVDALEGVNAIVRSSPLMLVYEKVEGNLRRPMVVVMDIHAPAWSEFPDLNITNADTDFGRLSGLAFVEKVLRSGNSEFEDVPVILLTEKPTGPWMQRLERLRKRPGGEIVLVSKEDPPRFVNDVKRLVEILRKPEARVTHRLPGHHSAEDPNGDALPYAAFLAALLQYWHLDPHKKFDLLDVRRPGDGWLEDVLTGRVLPPTDEIVDKMEILIEIRAKLGYLFRDRDAENHWLRPPARELGEKTPLQLLLSGKTEMQALVKSYVFYISGV